MVPLQAGGTGLAAYFLNCFEQICMLPRGAHDRWGHDCSFVLLKRWESHSTF